MLAGSYRKRLEADLARWVAAGFVTVDGANGIRRSLEAEGGFKLPALLGMFGGLLIAASVSAFVAANWEEMPRLMRLGLILAGVVVSLGFAVRLAPPGAQKAHEASATVAVLIFAAGVALIGQMYHLPADWPAGALLVGVGALAVAIALGSTGALVVALIAALSWSGGRFVEGEGSVHWAFLPFWAVCAGLALGRESRSLHHLVVLALGAWLAVLPGGPRVTGLGYGLIGYWLALSAAFTAVGAVALVRGWPSFVTAALPWGLLAFVLLVNVELFRILDADMRRPGQASTLNFVVTAVVVALLALLARFGERRFAWPLAAGLGLALLLPAIFWSGIVSGLPGKALVASIVLAIAVALVASGAGGGLRRLTLAGSALFAVAILILLWQTIGTLLDQSLFFLATGAALIGAAGGARRLHARFSQPAEPTP